MRSSSASRGTAKTRRAHPPLPPLRPLPILNPCVEPVPSECLIFSDGEPLESLWHVLNMNLLLDILNYRYRDRDDVFVGANMFIYFSALRAKNRDYRGPDVFFVNGNTDRKREREGWVVWEEDGRYPDVIFELMSRRTWKQDLTIKKEIYEKNFKTSEYFCYDPSRESLQGWRLSRGKYKAIKPDEYGRLWSEQMGLSVGTIRGEWGGATDTWVRLFDDDGNPAPTYGEAEEQRADAQERRAEAQERRADAEKERADAEKARADAMEAEVARLKAKLGAK